MISAATSATGANGCRKPARTAAWRGPGPGAQPAGDCRVHRACQAAGGIRRRAGAAGTRLSLPRQGNVCPVLQRRHGDAATSSCSSALGHLRLRHPPVEASFSTALAPARRVHGGRSASKRPGHHQRELSSPQRVAVRRDPLAHDDVRTCTAQRDRPPGRVLEEERLQRAGDEVHARNRTRHHARRSVTRRPARRRRPHRRRRDAEAQGRARALPPPRHRTPRCVRRAARPRNASAPIRGRPRRRTSRGPRTVPHQTPVSTHAAAASHRPARGHRRSSWTVHRPPRGTRPTARSADRHRRRRPPRADPAGRTPSPGDHRRNRTFRSRAVPLSGRHAPVRAVLPGPRSPAAVWSSMVAPRSSGVGTGLAS